MKIAICYDWLNTKQGGGEATLLQILDIYPQADLYCLVFNRQLFGEKIKNRTVVTSRLQRFPGFIKKRPYFMLPFIKKSISRFDFAGYDLVISVSSAWVKNITVQKPTVHISYCFSPARMLWDSWPAYLDTQRLFGHSLPKIVKLYISNVVSKLRLWDYYQAQQVDAYIAISQYISKRIAKYYHRKSIVVYPPVHLPKLSLKDKQEGDYYLVLSVLSAYKNIDSIIKYFKSNQQQKLIIAGDGPDSERLRLLAKNCNNISFAGRVSDDEKWTLLMSAKAFIFASVEDFGIAPVEAMHAGTPVIALRGGGLSETVIDGKTGIFYRSTNSSELGSAIAKCESTSFKPEDIAKQASKFSQELFKTNFQKSVQEALLTVKNETYNEKN